MSDLKCAFVAIILAMFSTASSAAQTTATATRPNVLILHADQWRAQAFGYAGDKDVITPNIDALARESANFVNAVSSLPVSTPARAATLTGQRPLTNGVFMNDIQLDPKAITIADVLAEAGYDTAYIGKWHLDGNKRRVITPPGPRRQGFQYWKAINCTHKYNKSGYYANNDPKKKTWSGYDVFAQGKDAQAYLADSAREAKPFFMMLSWGPPHSPYHSAPQKYKDMYDTATLTLRPNVPRNWYNKIRHDLGGYYAHLTAIDDALGQIIDTLKREKLYDNTIIMFTSDHGDLLGSHGFYGKQAPWDESIRVPMLVKYSGEYAVAPGPREAMMTCEDIMPTLLGMCGVQIPSSVQGADYSAYLRGGANPKQDDVADILCVQPSSNQWNRKSGGEEFRGLRTPRYTYVRNLDGPWYFYDNKTDPYQLHNLVGDARTSDVQNQLDTLLTKRLEAYGDEFLPGPDTARKYGYPKLNKNGAVPFTLK